MRVVCCVLVKIFGIYNLKFLGGLRDFVGTYCSRRCAPMNLTALRLNTRRPDNYRWVSCISLRCGLMWKGQKIKKKEKTILSIACVFSASHNITRRWSTPYECGTNIYAPRTTPLHLSTQYPAQPNNRKREAEKGTKLTEKCQFPHV